MPSRTRTNGSLSTTKRYYGSISGGGNYPAIVNAWNTSSASSPVINSGKVSGIQTYGTIKTMTDSVTPGYFRSVKNGGVLANNSCSASTLTCGSNIVYAYSGWLVRNPTSTTAYYARAKVQMPYGPPATIIPASPPGLVNKAIANARQQAMDLSTFAAEIGKTANMFAKVSSKAQRIFRTFISLRNLGKLPKNLADAWLEYRYGWTPLVHDLADIQSALVKIQRGMSWIAKGHQEGDDSIITSTGSPITIASLRYQVKTISKIQYGAYAAFRMDALASIQIDPIVTAWELIPFSFMVDWILDIGATVSALSPFANGELVSSGYVARVQSENQFVNASVYYGDFSSWVKMEEYLDIPQATGFTEQYVRIPQAATLSFGVSSSISFTHLLDLAALTSVLLKAGR